MLYLKDLEHYWQAVSNTTGNVEDYYRLFEVPGLAHCFGGVDGSASNVFGALVAWVENSEAPDTIPFTFKDLNGTTNTRPLCAGYFVDHSVRTCHVYQLGSLAHERLASYHVSPGSPK